MEIWFFISKLGAIVIIPLHFLLVEHLKLQERYGKEKGTKIGEIYGLISGRVSFYFGWESGLRARSIIMIYPGFKAMVTAGMGIGISTRALEYDIDLCAAAMATYLVVCFLLSIFFTRRREML